MRRPFGGLGFVRADLVVLGKKSRPSVLIRDRDPAAGLAGDLPLGRLDGPARTRCLARWTIVLLELADRPAQLRSFPAPTANAARRNTRVVECQLGRLPTLCATPGHRADSIGRRDAGRRALWTVSLQWFTWLTPPVSNAGPRHG